MPKTYTEQVPLAQDLTLAELDRIWRFALSRGTGLVTDRARIWTHQGTMMEEESLTEAIAALEPGEKAQFINVVAYDHPNDERIHMDWIERGSSLSRIGISSPEQTRALGIAEATRRFIKDRVYAERATVRSTGSVTSGHGNASPTSDTAGGGLRGWLHGLSIEVVGGLIVLGIVGLLGVLWAVFR